MSLSQCQDINVVTETKESLYMSLRGNPGLREAIYNANIGAQLYPTAGLCVTGSTYADTLSYAGNHIISLDSDYKQLKIEPDFTVSASGAANIITHAHLCNPITLPRGCMLATYHVLQVVCSGTLTLDCVTVRHGKAYAGGGVSYYVTLTVKGRFLSLVFAETGSGAIVNQMNTT